MAQALEPVIAEVDAGFAFELIGEQAAAHADLAMDAPDGEVDALRVEGLLPGQDVLVDAVHQRPIEIEQKHGLDAHRPGLLERASPRVSGAIEAESGNAPAGAPIVNRDFDLSAPRSIGAAQYNQLTCS